MTTQALREAHSKEATKPLRRYQVALLLAALTCWYTLATLPYLDRFPLVGRDEAQIAAPAYKLASEGVYGQDMYTGYYQSERYVYEFLPLHPVLLALDFKLLGEGVWQARLLSVLCGLTTVLLTFALGKRLCDTSVGLLAAASLCIVRLSLDPRASGVPLLDLARIVRYDIVVPPLVLAAVLCFIGAVTLDERRKMKDESLTFVFHLSSFVLPGLLTGLATLSHVYGAFVLPVFVVVLLWDDGWHALRRTPIYVIVAGWLIALLPWLLYALQDPAAYYGQTLWDQALGRFDVLNPIFYWHNLFNEPRRYTLLFGAHGSGLLQPRIGIWLLLGGVLAAYMVLVSCLLQAGDTRYRASTKDARYRVSTDCRLLFLLPIVPGALLALLVNQKIYSYLVLILPFLAIQMAFGLLTAWRWLARRARHAVLAGVIVLLAAFAEGGVGVAHTLQLGSTTSSYNDFTAAVARLLPPHARVLMVHLYWFGLVQFDTRSLDLPFRFSNPQYYQPQALPMEDALERIAPGYVLVDPLIKNYIFHPMQPDHPILDQQKRDFTVAIQRHCTQGVGSVDNLAYHDYGPLTVYRCDW